MYSQARSSYQILTTCKQGWYVPKEQLNEGEEWKINVLPQLDIVVHAKCLTKSIFAWTLKSFKRNLVASASYELKYY